MLQLEYVSATVRGAVSQQVATLCSCAIEVAGRIGDEISVRESAVGAVGKAVQDAFGPATAVLRQLKDRAASRGRPQAREAASGISHAEDTVVVNRDSRLRVGAIAS